MKRGQAAHLFIYVSALVAIVLFAVVYIPFDEAISVYMPDALNSTYQNQTLGQSMNDRAITTFHGFGLLFLIAVVFTLIYSGYSNQAQ